MGRGRPLPRRMQNLPEDMIYVTLQAQRQQGRSLWFEHNDNQHDVSITRKPTGGC